MIEGATGTGKDLLAKVVHSSSDRADKPFVKNQLRGAARHAPGIGNFRVFQRRVHRRGQGQARTLHGGRGRHPLPGRNRGPSPGLAGEAFACHRGQGVLSAGKQAHPEGGRSGDIRDQPGAGKAGGGRAVSQGPLLPSQRAADRNPGAEGAQGGPSPAHPPHHPKAVRCPGSDPASPSKSRPCSFLLNHDYPGNVRELENMLEHAIIVSRGDAIGPGHLPEYLFKEKTTARSSSSAQIGQSAGNDERRKILESARKARMAAKGVRRSPENRP